MDLNGDGDASDLVLHTFDAATGAVTNVGLDATFFQFQLQGDFVVFGVSESQQGGTDLNGDGDTSDFIVHVYNASSHTVLSLGGDGKGTDSTAFHFQDGRLAFARAEFFSGPADLNGDGDTFDVVPHLFDARTGAITNLRLASVAYRLLGARLAFLVLEFAQRIDLNGDGDSDDRVIHLFDATSGSVTNLGLAAFNSGTDVRGLPPHLPMDGDRLAFLLHEAEQRQDGNGDGDTFDLIPHILDASTGTLTSVGINADTGSRPLLLNGNVLAFVSGEFPFGNLNGDTDSNDLVPHLFDIATGTLHNLRRDASISDFALDRGRLPFFVSEFGQGNTDLNADGDVRDAIYHIAELSPDADGDGICGNVDACPTEAPSLGLDADRNGCTDTIAGLKTIVQGLSINSKLKSGLLGKLNEAQKALDRGSTLTAVNKLRDFIAMVEGQRGKGISASDADLLVAYANNLIVLISP